MSTGTRRLYAYIKYNYLLVLLPMGNQICNYIKEDAVTCKREVMVVRKLYMMCTVFCCFSVYAQSSLWISNHEPIETLEQFHEVCMDLWTRIDLVQAISTNNFQKKVILRHLMKNFMCLSVSLEKISSVEESHFYKKLLQSMHFSFLNAFPFSKNPSYEECLRHLSTMIKRLEGPVYLEADCAT